MASFTTFMDSPIGPLRLTSDGSALTGLWMDAGPDIEDIRDDATTPFGETIHQLKAYFAGQLRAFDLPLAPQGTPFQQDVWRELLAIPYGTTISYGELARRLGQPSASRAVGLANGRNPISIIIPCHRVIGAGGKLTGYGGGLPRKEALLAFEASVLAGGPRLFSSQPWGNLPLFAGR